MFPYWILFSVYAVCTLQYRRRGDAAAKAGAAFILLGLATALMIGLRYRVGADWEAYEEIFFYTSRMRYGDALAIGDPGYSLLNWWAGLLGFDLWFVNLLCGLIFTWGLIRFARRQSNPWLTVVVAVPYLIIVVGMGYTRQSAALGFILAGLAHFRSTAMLRFAGYIFLAASFHKTAVIVLPLVAVATGFSRLAGGLSLLAIGYFLYNTFLSASMDLLITNYIEREYQSEGAGIRVAMNLVPAVLFLLFSRRFGLSDDHRRIWRIFAFVACAMLPLLLFTPSSTAIDRVSIYLIPIQLVVLSRLPDAFPDKGKPNMQLALLVILYSAIVQFVWFNYAVHARYWVPYQLYPLFGVS